MLDKETTLNKQWSNCIVSPQEDERRLTLSGQSIFTLKIKSKFKLFYLTLLKHE